MPDHQLIKDLLRAAHDCGAPNEIEAGECGEFDYPAPGGWTVRISFDCGELNYIHSFKSAGGDVIDLWGAKKDPRIDDGDDENGQWCTLQLWRGQEDTDQLLKLAKERVR